MSAKSFSHLGAAAFACAALAGCGGGSGAAAPRVTAIPLQQTTGGTAFSLDLEDWVTDREGQALTFSVVSGGGSFAGSVYSNTFETLGTYQVEFSVADSDKTTTDTFNVEVQTANLAVVRSDGKNLSVLDTDTEQLVLVSASTAVETMYAGLTLGHVVFERQSGTNYDLFAYDLAARRTWTLGDSPTLAERFGALTSDGRVVFTSGTSTDTDLLVWNSATGLTRGISATTGQHDRNPLVNADDIVFYERSASGQPDIWYYDPDTDESTAVSTDANAETLLAALPDGSVVFSRLGAGGETDLFWFKIGSGLAEIGGDLGAAVGLQNKTYHAYTSDSRVVFSATAAATDKSLYFWQTGASSAIDTSEDLTYRAISSGDVVVYTIETAGQDDVYAFDVQNGTPGTPLTVSTDADDETVRAAVTKTGSSFVVYTRAAGPDSMHVYAVTGAVTTNLTHAAGIEFEAALENGDVVYRRADGSAVFHYDPLTTTSTSVTTALAGTAMAFAGAGSAAGDFVITETVAAQTDLHLWDHSALARVEVSSTLGNDVWQAMTSAGEVLFTRVVSGNTNADLFLFDPADTSVTRLTEADGLGLLHDWAVLDTYAADRR